MIGTLLALWVMGVSAQAQEAEAVLHEFAAGAPAARAADGSAREAMSLADATGLWSDPVFSMELSSLPIDSFGLTHTMSGVQYRLQQQLPVPGALGAQRAMATAGAREMRARADGARVQLEAQLIEAYWRVGLTQRLLELTEAHRLRAKELLGAVTARYQVGQAGQSHVLRLQLLHDQLEDEVSELRSELEQRRAALLALGGPVMLDQLKWEKDVPPLSAPSALTSWIAAAHDRNPTVLGRQAAVARADAADRFARTTITTPVTLWAGYRVRKEHLPQDVGRDFVSLGAAFALPVAGVTRARAQMVAADAGQESAKEGLSAAMLAVEGELTALHVQWVRASERALRYDAELRPLAVQSLDAALAAFQAGEGAFGDLYDAEVVLLDVDRALARATYQTYVVRARARALTGGSLP